MNEASKKYYWLKISKDFFNGHFIKIIRNMKDGYAMISFYQLVMLESINHAGHLMESATRPYTIKDLAAVTDIPIEIARKANKVLSKYELFKWNPKTGELELPQMKDLIDSETYKAQMMRDLRARENADKTSSVGNNVTKMVTMLPPNGNNVTANGNNVTPLPPDLYSVLDIRNQKLETRTKNNSSVVVVNKEVNSNSDSLLSSVPPKVGNNNDLKVEKNLGDDKKTKATKAAKEFYSSYPECKVKQNYSTVLHWYLTNPDSTIENWKLIQQSLLAHINGDNWRKENGAYIPSPLNFLLKKKWLDSNESIGVRPPLGIRVEQPPEDVPLTVEEKKKQEDNFNKIVAEIDKKSKEHYWERN